MSLFKAKKKKYSGHRRIKVLLLPSEILSIALAEHSW